MNYEYSGEERRKFPRKKTTIGIVYTVLYSGEGIGIIRDISEGGFCFLSDKNIPIGTIIKAKFSLPHSEQARPMDVVGKIVWYQSVEDGYVMGVRVLS